MTGAPPRAFRTAAAFRAWLARNHGSAGELLVRLNKVGTEGRGMSYTEALDAALCFGWIDGVRRRLDDSSYTIRFSPRKPRSIWSRVNVRKVAALIAAGRMQPPGLAAFEARTAARTGVYSFERKPMTLGRDFARRIRAVRPAWAHFEKQPPYYRRVAVFWIMSAKQEKTRLRRLQILIRWSAKGQRIPLTGPLT